jgi:hypothetical protein
MWNDGAHSPKVRMISRRRLLLGVSINGQLRTWCKTLAVCNESSGIQDGDRWFDIERMLCPLGGPSGGHRSERRQPFVRRRTLVAIIAGQVKTWSWCCGLYPALAQPRPVDLHWCCSETEWACWTDTDHHPGSSRQHGRARAPRRSRVAHWKRVCLFTYKSDAQKPSKARNKALLAFVITGSLGSESNSEESIFGGCASGRLDVDLSHTSP